MNITRFHDMERINLDVEFLTPTFLGGADQQAELRSAPFKNLLRQWWRVVNGSLDADTLRTREGELFGTVLGDDECTSSRVRIALTPGKPFIVQNNPFQLGATRHPEVGQNGMNVQNSLYLGFGPVTYHQGQMNFRHYIAPGSMARFSITFPHRNREEIVRALQYVDAFGTIGSRSRNGYGSLSLTSDAFDKLDPATLQTNGVGNLVANNAKEYTNHFGGDEQGLLLWESAQNGWEGAMTLLAGTYLRTRTEINIAGGPNTAQERHILGFPVTHHNVPNWGGNNGRMPSQLRLMVKRNAENRIVARILHLPHRLPNDKPWPNQLPSQYDVWRQVHQFLDAQNQFNRIGGAA